MRAEIKEVYSSGVKISPIKKFAPENREMILHKDNIDNWVAVNTVPRYHSETMVGFGMGIDLMSDLSSFDRDSLDALFYLHPANVGNKKMLLHDLGVIFKHLPWAKNLNLDDEIKKIVSEGKFIDMRHLLDNTRFTRAVIGVSYISDVIFEGKLRIEIVGECEGWNNTCERITQKLHPDCSEVRLTPISGGYSGSLDFKVNAWDRSGRKEMPFVLKKLEAVLKFETFEINSDGKLCKAIELEKIFLAVNNLSEIPRIPSTLRDPKVLKAFLCVQKLREYANVITLLDEDISQYFFSLFAYSMRVLLYGSVNDYAKKYAWISSSMLCQKLI